MAFEALTGLFGNLISAQQQFNLQQKAMQNDPRVKVAQLELLKLQQQEKRREQVEPEIISSIKDGSLTDSKLADLTSYMNQGVLGLAAARLERQKAQATMQAKGLPSLEAAQAYQQLAPEAQAKEMLSGETFGKELARSLTAETEQMRQVKMPMAKYEAELRAKYPSTSVSTVNYNAPKSEGTATPSTTINTLISSWRNLIGTNRLIDASGNPLSTEKFTEAQDHYFTSNGQLPPGVMVEKATAPVNDRGSVPELKQYEKAEERVKSYLDNYWDELPTRYQKENWAGMNNEDSAIDAVIADIVSGNDVSDVPKELLGYIQTILAFPQNKRVGAITRGVMATGSAAIGGIESDANYIQQDLERQAREKAKR